MKLPSAIVLFVLTAMTPAVAAQTTQDATLDSAAHEIEVYASGRVGISGIATEVPNWSGGGRFGWILTDPVTPRFWGFRFEYAMDFVPVFMNFQRDGIAYGVEFNPVVTKWNLRPHGRWQPYGELSFGIGEFNIKAPPGTSRFNFTPGASVGVRILRGKYAWSIGINYQHFSNADLAPSNPGDDSMGIRISLSRWLK
jgi:hypothetical protein